MVWEQIAGHGREFTPAPLPADISLMRPGRCFGNAALTALGATTAPRYAYAEGFAVDAYFRAWFYHAWNVTPEGAVIDRTWPETGLRYVGVSFADDQVRERGPGLSLILPDHVDLAWASGDNLRKQVLPAPQAWHTLAATKPEQVFEEA
jgi:hypothetical protein